VTAPAGEKLNELIGAVPNLSDPSTTKFNKINEWLAHLIGLGPEQVWTGYVSKPGNLNVRFRQPGPTKLRPELGVALIDDKPDYLEKCVSPASLLVAPGGHIGAMALVSAKDGAWEMARIIERSGGPTAPRLLEYFPDAQVVHPAKISTASASKGPAGSLTTVPLVVGARIRRMIRLAIASAPAVMLVGPPGTGKTTLLQQVLDEIAADPSAYGFKHEPSSKWVTPEESWTTRELVGGETVDESGRLRFALGRVLEAIREDEWLVLDEANRADMDKIFGGLLTWLAGHPVELGRASTDADAPTVRLGWSDTAESKVEGVERLAAKDPGTDPIEFLAGREWRLLGTYNALDAQRVFRFGQALGRRFVRVPIPALSIEEFADALEGHAHALPVEVEEAVKACVVGLYAAHYAAQETTLGPALFFWMPEYVRVGLELGLLEDVEGDAYEDVELVDGQTGSHALSAVDQLLAEAYLSAAGVWLSKLEDEELDGLEERVLASSALTGEEWTWIRSLLPALG